MNAVFISYAHEDESTARRLAESLARQGHSVFWARHIAPGTTWEDTIERELHGARCVLVLWSKQSVRSQWVKTEAGEAADRGVLVPVLIEEAELPLQFKHIQTANLVGWDEDEGHPEWQSVLEAVRKLTAGSAVGTVAPTPRTASGGRRHRRRPIWLLVALMLLLGGTYGVYEAYRVAIRKGLLSSQVPFCTVLLSAEGLAVGDAVTIDGIPVGSIVEFELVPPAEIYKVYVSFMVDVRRCFFVGTESRAQVRWNPAKTKRSIELPSGFIGVPSYLSSRIEELPARQAIMALERSEAVLAQEVRDGTNVLARPMGTIASADARRIAELGVERLLVSYPKLRGKEPTAIWDPKEGKYVLVSQYRRGFFVPAEEVPPAER